MAIVPFKDVSMINTLVTFLPSILNSTISLSLNLAAVANCLEPISSAFVVVKLHLLVMS